MLGRDVPASTTGLTTMRLAIGACAWALAAAGTGLLLDPGHTAPWIRIRWSATAADDIRRQAERDLQLEGGSFSEGRTWSYALLDDTVAGVRRVVGHPLVEDTHAIDRTTFAVSPEAGRGPYRARLRNVLPGVRGIGPALGWVTAGMWLLGAAALGTELPRLSRVLRRRWRAGRNNLRERSARGRRSSNVVVRAALRLVDTVGGVTIGAAIVAAVALARFTHVPRWLPENQTPETVLLGWVPGTWGGLETDACVGGAPDKLFEIDRGAMTWSEDGVRMTSHDVAFHLVDLGNRQYPGLEVVAALGDGSRRRLLGVIDGPTQLSLHAFEATAPTGDLTRLPRPDRLTRCDP